MDSECKHRDLLGNLVKGRDSAYPHFPMAVGVAHPCIEAWLLADPSAIASAFNLSGPVVAPPDPENLPAPQANRDHNPKTVLAKCGGRSAISSKEATQIALAICDLLTLQR